MLTLLRGFPFSEALPETGILGQEDHELEASLGNTEGQQDRMSWLCMLGQPDLCTSSRPAGDAQRHPSSKSRQVAEMVHGFHMVDVACSVLYVL